MLLCTLILKESFKLEELGKWARVCTGLVGGKMSLPKYDSLFNPLLEAIKKLGGSASISELNEEVAKSLHLTDEEISQPHDERGTELQYRLSWARTYLKAYGLLDNSERGVWVLTPKGKDTDAVDQRQVARFVNEQGRVKKGKLTVKNSVSTVDVEVAELAETVLEETWRGAVFIDLVDGEEFLDKLKELGLGVNIKKIEQVSVVPEFFKEI